MAIVKKLADQEYVSAEITEKVNTAIDEFNCIIDVETLPTENIQNDSFYRYQGDIYVYSTEQSTVSEKLPTETRVAEMINTQIAAIPTPDVSGPINAHNTATDSHNDIRLLVEGLTTRLNTLADSDDTTLDQMSEIVNYIKSNKTLIEEVTTNKVNVTDIIDNLTTNVANKPLSAAQGVALKALIDAIIVPTKVSELTNDSGYLTSYTETDPTVPAWAKQPTKPSYTAAEVGALSDSTVIPTVPTKVSAFTNDAGYLTEHQDISGKLDVSELPTAINTALAQAKASGEFDGKDGEDGYNPVKGLDYWTPTDEQEIEAFIAAELAKRGQLKPEFANSIEECADTTKLYVLPDGFLYAYMQHEEIVEGGTVANFTNLLTDSRTVIKNNVRYSQSGAAFKAESGCDSVIIPIPTSGSVTIRMRGCEKYSGYPNVYGGTDFNGVTFATTFIGGDAGWKTDGNGDTYFTFTNTAGCTCIVFMTPTVDTASDIVTANEEITYTTSEGGTEIVTVWANTGHAFVPADYEDRILALEETVKRSSSTTGVNGAEVFAPSPQLPADSSSEADFDAENMTAQNIYGYFDALCEKYPNYITKETLGKDASGTLDVNRYVLCRHYYKAWQRVNYPKMYAWVNGSTVIYSKSVSPRIGDTLYTTNYVGTANGAVTAVSNANQTRTVGGVVYTRDSSKDVEPTLVFTSIIGNAVGGTVYNSSQASVTKVSTITDSSMTGENGVSYVRYPMGDRSRTMERSTVVTIGANEHGFTPDPREPAIVCARLARDLCECRNADNLFLNHLKNEVMLIIVPVINPYGFNLGTGAGYYNKNGVNINRNYDCPGWGNLTDAGPQGDYGGSEIETQYFMNTISEPGSAVAISVHALGYSENGGSTMTHYQGNNFNFEKIAEVAEVMAANYNLQFTDYGRTPPDNNQGGKSPAYITWAGAVGGLIEMQAEGASAERNTAYILEADYTLLLQCINMWLSDYKESL